MSETLHLVTNSTVSDKTGQLVRYNVLRDNNILIVNNTFSYTHIQGHDYNKRNSVGMIYHVQHIVAIIACDVYCAL